MSSFFARRSQNCQKDSQVKHFFALLGSVSVKAARKRIDEIDPRSVTGRGCPALATMMTSTASGYISAEQRSSQIATS